MASGKRPHSHVVRLLEQLLTQVEPAALAYDLNASSPQLEAYLMGTERMSTDEQLRFASFVLARFPQFARLAHRVAAQAHAERAYHANATLTHMNTPPSR